MPLTVPEVVAVNLTPTSTPAPPPESGGGGGVAPQSEQGQPMLTVVATLGVSTLPLSSTARDSILVVGSPSATQASGQVTVGGTAPVIAARCHAEPPSG